MELTHQIELILSYCKCKFFTRVYQKFSINQKILLVRLAILPLNNNQCRIDMKNKHYRLIQEAKRAPPQDTCMFLSSSFD